MNRVAGTVLPLLMSVLAGCDTLSVWTSSTEARQWQAPLDPNHFTLDDPSASVIGEPQKILARYEDTFTDIARAYGLGYDELRAANPDIDPWLPGEGTEILLPTQYVLPDAPRQGLVLNVASKRLFYYPPAEAGQPLRVSSYPVGIGRVGWRTPLGETRVVARARDPHWYVPASIRREHARAGDPLPEVVPPGPDNPLGSRVLQLGMPGYLIHGTNKPGGVGMRVSHGCVRLYPEDIEALYERVAIGEPVVIVNQPYLLGWLDGQPYLEAHQPLEDDRVPPGEQLLLKLEQWRALYGLFADRDQQALAAALAAAGRGVPTLLLDREGDSAAGPVRWVHRARPELAAAERSAAAQPDQ